MSRIVSEAFWTGIWIDANAVLYRLVLVQSLKQRERSVSHCLGKASTLRLDLPDASSSPRARLGRCSRRQYQEECTAPEDLARGLEPAGEYRCGPGYIHRCLKATSPNHRTTDSICQATWPSPSTADIQSSHILRRGRSRKVAKTTDARQRKVPWHGLARY